MRNISIDLCKSNLPNSISEVDFVQYALKDQLKEKINECLNYSDIDQSGNNVFFIDGTRGAGKSTFMQNLVDYYSSGHQSKICSLPCIDPTKLPGNEPVLVTVIALLNRKVKEKLDGHAWDEEQKTKVKWEQNLYELSKGLQRLTASEYKPEFFDDSLQLHSQLDYSSGGQSLEMTFNKLLESACSILKCRAIMLCV
ncbi:hypothetical protein [Photobacterium leiognathi]|uniref:hypothetical protein n=1 Tax=Photobacterium leiognathi TaxID=553611 RepID=UPI0027371803|nr:hypothetical protein [Photobacterium leiognathi]